MKKLIAIVLALAVMAAMLGSGLTSATLDGVPMVLLSSATYEWTDPESGGEVLITENVYEGAVNEAGEFIPHDMTWEYVVVNLTYDPIPGITNGFSGFQILFDVPVPELYNQLPPIIGGPWQQNAFSFQWPPFGVEWDAPLPWLGIMPGQTGTFSFCTFERARVVIEESGIGQGPAGWAHTWGLPVEEEIIDADGSLTPGTGLPAAQEVSLLDPLTRWPTGMWVEGIDWFDNDVNCAWSAGDDLHVEDPATHPGALRDALHDQLILGVQWDPAVLDLDGSFLHGQPVHVDLETGLVDPSGTGASTCPGVDPMMTFFDANGDTFWNDGEDIVLDANLDLIFGEVINTQTYIHHGPNSVPGELWNMLDVACSDDDIICKKVKYIDEDRDGIIEVGEPVSFLMVIQVHNSSAETWTDVTVKDRFGAEIELVSVDGVKVDPPSKNTSWSPVPPGPNVTVDWSGKSVKVHLTWNVGDLAPGDTANLVLMVATDLNPGGHQEYTEPGIYEFNSGAVLKFLNPDGKQRSLETGGILLSVLP